MSRAGSVAILLAFISCASVTACADIIYLNNGGEMEGIVEKEDDNTVVIDTGFGTVTFRRSQVRNIVKSGEAETSNIREVWRKERELHKSKEKEYERARNERAKKASEDLASDAQAKNLNDSKEIKQVNVTREAGGKGIVVEVLLNGSVKANLVLDTGASVIALSRKVGEALGFDLSDTKKDVIEVQLANGSKAMARAIILESVKIQDVEVRNVAAAIMLDEVQRVGLTGGLLGMSFLSRFNIKVDAKKMKMTLERIDNP